MTAPLSEPKSGVPDTEVPPVEERPHTEPPPAPSAWSSHAATVMEHGGRGARATVQTLAERRGLRTVLLGLAVTVVALLIGGAIAVPLLVVGVLMLLAGAMGPRLGGHVGLDFGPEGTSITFNAQIAPPGRRLAAAPAQETAPSLPPRPRIALAAPPVRRPTPEPKAEPVAAADVDSVRVAADVDSTGETMEIDARDLRARLDAESAVERAG